MIVLAFLISSTITPLELGSELARCSMRVLFGGPSPEVMYVHAVATGTRTRVPVDAGVARGNEILPDSAVAFELRVIEAIGGLERPAPGDVIMVTPWNYVADCSRRAWDGPWVEGDEETVLTVVGSELHADGSHFHVLGGIAAYPQGSWHAVRGRTHPDRGPGEDWMAPGQFFELLGSLPSLSLFGWNEGREANERVVDIIRNGPAPWSNVYPGTEILRMAERMLSTGPEETTQR